MDKFVIKTKVPAPQPSEKKQNDKRYTQSTIESLKGIVVVEDIQRWKSILKTPDQSDQTVLETLQCLSAKIPSRQVLKTSKIGHVVKNYQHSKDPEIRKLARKLLQNWSTHYEEKSTQQVLEVKCDKKTERIRSAARKHIKEAISVDVLEEEKDRITSLPELIEREAFFMHGRKVTSDYSRCMRKLVFTLKNQTDVRKNLIKSKIEPKIFINQYGMFKR